MGSDKAKKACFNCTKRRIICDLTPPKCKKCEKKGLDCPGYGVRYRFAEGKTASPAEIRPGSNAATAPSTRLKWVDVTGRSKHRRRGLEASGTKSNASRFESYSGMSGGLGETQRQSNVDIQKTGGLDVATSSQQLSTDVIPAQSEKRTLELGFSHETGDLTTGDDSDTIEITRDDWLHSPSISNPPAILHNLPPLLSNPIPKLRLLFNHFSLHVSPVMLMYDDGGNGYRHEILPLAHINPMVERAVCVAAAFHLSQNDPELRLPAESGRAAIINKLSSMSFDLSDSTWATILLLIVADLVTGHEHVITLYKMLVAFLDARGRVSGQHGLGGGTPLGDFLFYQSRVISFFAYPIMGGSKAISDLARVLKDPFRSSEQPHAPWQHLPLEFLVTADEGEAFSLALVDTTTQLYVDIIHQTTQIYLLRANSADQSPELPSNEAEDLEVNLPVSCRTSDHINSRLTKVRHLLNKVDPSAPGSHTMVWPAFVSAAEARNDDDREFFTAVLQRIWKATGYTNVLKGLEALPNLWEQQRLGRNWTSLLPTLKTVVM